MLKCGCCEQVFDGVKMYFFIKGKFYCSDDCLEKEFGDDEHV
jgi:hypothetical protein